MSARIGQAVRTNFDFLNTVYGFNGPFEWHIAYELEFTYVKDRIFINIAYDGAYMCSVGKTKKHYPELSNGRMLLNQIDYREKHTHDLSELFTGNEKQAVLKMSDKDEVLAVMAERLKNYPQLLNGDFSAFSFPARLKRKFRKTGS